MNMQRPENTEHNITKAGGNHESASQKLQDQYMHLMSSGKNLADHAVKTVTSEVGHLDIPQIWNHGIKQVESGLGSAAKSAWNSLDSNSTTHYIKHDICNDEPIKVGVAALAVAGVGSLAVAIAAPEAAAAAAVGIGLSAADALPTASVAAIVGGLGGYGLNMDYDNRHPHH